MMHRNCLTVESSRGRILGESPLNMLKISKLVRGLVRPLRDMQAPQRLAELELKLTHPVAVFRANNIFWPTKKM